MSEWNEKRFSLSLRGVGIARDEAIQPDRVISLDCFAVLAMTGDKKRGQETEQALSAR